MVDTEFMVATVRTVLPDAKVEATDTTGGGDHWRVVVEDEAFAGLRPLARQRMVLAAFKPHIATNVVHALDLSCKAPGER